MEGRKKELIIRGGANVYPAEVERVLVSHPAVADAAVLGSAGNTSPTASFSFACSDLSCEFDASGSRDSDGTIASYAWDFV